MELKSANIKIGVVTDCLHLAVLDKPRIDSDLVGSLTCLSKVYIHDEQSTKDYYHITSEEGVTGFCSKRYIATRR